MLLLAPYPWPLSIGIVGSILAGAVIGLAVAVKMAFRIMDPEPKEGLLGFFLLTWYGPISAAFGAASGYVGSAYMSVGNHDPAALSAAAGIALLALIRERLRRHLPPEPRTAPPGRGEGAASR